MCTSNKTSYYICVWFFMFLSGYKNWKRKVLVVTTASTCYSQHFIHISTWFTKYSAKWMDFQVNSFPESRSTSPSSTESLPPSSTESLPPSSTESLSPSSSPSPSTESSHGSFSSVNWFLHWESCPLHDPFKSVVSWEICLNWTYEFGWNVSRRAASDGARERNNRIKWTMSRIRLPQAPKPARRSDQGK